MGIDPSALPNAFLSKMDKADRQPLGKAGVTAAEAETKNAFRREKQLQERCVALLRLRNILPNVSRMDRRKTDKVGWPDLTFSHPTTGRFGIPCAFECKLPGCHPTPEQTKVMQHLLDNGWFVRVITSEEQFLEALKTLETNS
jgi:hypothetical protein